MNELAKKTKCVQIRTGVEIWMEDEKAEALMALFSQPNPPQFIRYEGRMINKADLCGVFLPEDMQSSTRRKNGEWTCKQGSWHAKGEKCECLDKQTKTLIQRREEAITACGKCMSGWVQTDNGMAPCPCIQKIV